MKNFFKIIVLMTISITLMSCATEKTAVENPNYAEMPIGKDMYVVSLSQKETTPSSQTDLLKRAAELTVAKGYQYFRVFVGTPALGNVCGLVSNPTSCMTIQIYKTEPKPCPSCTNISRQFDAKAMLNNG